MTITLRDDSVSGSSFVFDTTLGKLGEGRHVTAYLAQYRWPQGAKPVVVKVPKTGDVAVNSRIQRQGEVATETSCLPHVVAVLPVKSSDGKVKDCIAVEYLRGITLTRFIDGDLKPRFDDTYVNVQSFYNRYRISRDKTACELLKGVAAAIKLMHDAGIAHEELTADDVLLTADGSVALTGTGQARSNGKSRDDLYRIGVIAYQLCVGDCDLEQVNLGNVYSSQMQGFIRKALSRNYDDIGEVIADLKAMTAFTAGPNKRSLFGGGRKSAFTVDAGSYGVFLADSTPRPTFDPVIDDASPAAEPSVSEIPGLHPVDDGLGTNQNDRQDEAKRQDPLRVEAERREVERLAKLKADAARAEAERKAKLEAEAARAKAEAEAKRLKEEQEAVRKAAEAKAAEERARLKAKQEREIARIKQEAKQREEEARRKAEEAECKARKEREARLRAEKEARKTKDNEKNVWNKPVGTWDKRRNAIIGAMAAVVVVVGAIIALWPGDDGKGNEPSQADVSTEVNMDKATTPAVLPVKKQVQSTENPAVMKSAGASKAIEDKGTSEVIEDQESNEPAVSKVKNNSKSGKAKKVNATMKRKVKRRAKSIVPQPKQSQEDKKEENIKYRGLG